METAPKRLCGRDKSASRWHYEDWRDLWSLSLSCDRQPQGDLTLQTIGTRRTRFRPTPGNPSTSNKRDVGVLPRLCRRAKLWALSRKCRLRRKCGFVLSTSCYLPRYKWAMDRSIAPESCIFLFNEFYLIIHHVAKNKEILNDIEYNSLAAFSNVFPRSRLLEYLYPLARSLELSC